VTYTVTVSNAGPTDAAGAGVTVKMPAGFTGMWVCKATPDSGCAEPLSTGNLTASVYVAAGGTVKLTAIGPASGPAPAVVVALGQGYTDTACGQSCSATVSAATVSAAPVSAAPVSAPQRLVLARTMYARRF
jgi:hypothetical protein